LEPTTVAALVKYFNIASVTVLAFFAAFGVIAIVRKKSRLNIFGGSAFLTAFCVAALAAFAAEATVFNFQYYLKHYAGPKLETAGLSSEDPTIVLTSDSTVARLIVEHKDGITSGGIAFQNLNRIVTSVFVDLDFNGNESVEMVVVWKDRSGGSRVLTKNIGRGFPQDRYTPVQPHGAVSELTLIFRTGAGPEVGNVFVAINERIPFYFSGLRLLVVSLLVFAFITYYNRTLRAKAAYCLFEYKFDPANKRQNIAYALSVLLLILFSWICAYTSPSKAHLEEPVHHIYNKFLVDALISGETGWKYGNSEKLLEVEPRYRYDTQWLKDNGYVEGVDYMWDWAWYKGKYYSYFGVVPAVILFVPYKLITGNHLSNHGGIFIMASIAVIFMAMLWRFFVKKYMPDARFAFYLLALLTLYFASGLYAMLRHPLAYDIVQTAGFMFAVAGIYLLFKSVENGKVSRVKLFFACLCFALIAGCRPNVIFLSFLIPVILWKYRSWKLLPYIVVPFVMVAIPLCAYNYARFGSVSDFGGGYNLTQVNQGGYGALSLIGIAVKIFVSSMYFLFYPLRYSLHFPFIETVPPIPRTGITLGVFRIYEAGCAMINFPIVFCLFYMFKNTIGMDKLKKLCFLCAALVLVFFAAVFLSDYVVFVRRYTVRFALYFIIPALFYVCYRYCDKKDKPETFYFLYTFLALGLFMVILISHIIGFAGRYAIDLAVCFIIPALFCAYYWCNDKNSVYYGRGALKIVYVLLAASIMTGLFLFVQGTPFIHCDPTLYRYLEYSLGIVRDV
jgi:hypothetical protein